MVRISMVVVALLFGIGLIVAPRANVTLARRHHHHHHHHNGNGNGNHHGNGNSNKNGSSFNQIFQGTARGANSGEVISGASATVSGSGINSASSTSPDGPGYWQIQTSRNKQFSGTVTVSGPGCTSVTVSVDQNGGPNQSLNTNLPGC